MLLYLFKDQELPDFQQELNSGSAISFTVDVDITSNVNSDVFVDFKAEFESRFPSNSWAMTVTLDLTGRGLVGCPDGEMLIEGGLHCYNIGAWVKSDALKALQEVLFYGCNDDELEITVKLTCLSRSPDRKPYKTRTLTTRGNEFHPQLDDNGLFLHDCYMQRKFQHPFPDLYYAVGYHHQWTISMEIERKDFISFFTIIPRISATKRQTFMDRKLCDFEISSDDGTSIPCHKKYLCAKSHVLSCICEGPFKEAKEKKVFMDMSTSGVIALLRYLYYDAIYPAIKSCVIALELLQSADKYELTVLWKGIETILMEKPASWYEVDVALKLFKFVSFLDHEELMTKMVQVLSLKKEELSVSPLFGNMFPSSEERNLFFLELEYEMNMIQI